MAQEFQQVQKQTQSIVLAPQLRNSLKILQSPAMDLRTAILEELQANPLLEELPIEGISVDERLTEPDVNDDKIESEELQFDDSDYSILDRMSEDMREQFAQENSGQNFSTEDEERREHFFNSLTSTVSLQQHLIGQAEMAECSKSEQEALIYLIGSLDDNGFYNESLPNAALASRLLLADLQKAAEILKTFDPPGIGSADMRDCLLNQLSLQGRKQSLAARILRDHFELLVRRRIPDLSRKTGAPKEDVEDAIAEIGRLDPAPGKQFSADSNTVIEPDVTVYKDEYNEWQIILNNDYIPRLRINSVYKDLLAKGSLDRKEKDFLLERMRSGKFLINSIEQRQQTIERITREILDCQASFFAEGISKLRPLTMSAIAQTVGVHETTVSRAIANKYIRTPHGVFPFKYFFTPGFTVANGESVSNKTIKDKIQHIIDSENPAKPLSDQGIVRILADQDVKIARRTVAKYRDELGILPTNLRRRYD
ncbi:MAG: RNA polymerase factor sigma-54 [Coraliomargaritaceae bacterium]